MENGLFSFPAEMFNRNVVGMDGFGLHTSNSIIQSHSCDLNDQPTAYRAYTIHSALQGELISNVHAGTQITDRADGVGPEAPARLVMSLERSSVSGASVGNSSHFPVGASQEQFLGENTVAATAHFPARNNHPENLGNFPIAGSVYPLELPWHYMSNDALRSAGLSNVSYGGVDVIGRADGKGILDQVNAALELTGKTPIRSEIQPYSSTMDPETATWMSTVHENLSADNPHNSCRFSNELSLSLSTSQPSVMNGRGLPDQCDDLSCSGITRLGSGQGSSASKELSLSCNSHKAAGHFSQAICGSKYLQVMQEILAEFEIFRTQNMDQMCYQSMTGLNAPFLSFDPSEGGARLTGFDESPCMDAGFEVPLDPMQRKRALETKKRQLVNLLQAVDDRFSQCLDEIHTVVSAFHAATELDPQVHTRFVLQSVSFFYKNLRAKISNQILAMGASETQKSPGTSSFEEQLKIKDQLWRPQRGLPETSVSVLRAWMFQNFLHPYPKDAEKHLLAIKSGLTRSQVSNWFINARVRLWKPLIEEMCAEMNRRKARQIGS